MSEFDICQSYRQAKEQKKMIKTLADLNAVPVENIMNVLVRCGEIDRPKQNETKKPRVRMTAKTLPSDFADIMEKYDTGIMTRKEAAKRCGMTENGFAYWAQQRYHDKLIGI